MAVLTEARRLVGYIESLGDLQLQKEPPLCYGHMGATLCDAGLQAGLNYRTVVAPRINRLLRDWPDASTTSLFSQEINIYGLRYMLNWSHEEKPQRILDMVLLLLNQNVETEQELRTWLRVEDNLAALRCIRGVGPKTVDYLLKLVGEPAVAIDRHLRSFAFWAGVEIYDYDEMNEVYRSAADLLGVECSVLDGAIWVYVSTLSAGDPRVSRAGRWEQSRL